MTQIRFFLYQTSELLRPLKLSITKMHLCSNKLSTVDLWGEVVSEFLCMSVTIYYLLSTISLLSMDKGIYSNSLVNFTLERSKLLWQKENMGPEHDADAHGGHWGSYCREGAGWLVKLESHRNPGGKAAAVWQRPGRRLISSKTRNPNKAKITTEWLQNNTRRTKGGTIKPQLRWECVWTAVHSWCYHSFSECHVQVLACAAGIKNDMKNLKATSLSRCTFLITYNNPQNTLSVVLT